MSSVNRVLKKRREAHGGDNFIENSNQTASASQSHQQKSTVDNQREKTYEPYADYSQYNPGSFQFSNTFLPGSLQLYNRYRAPLSCFIEPVNQQLEYIQQSANTIPRCSSCRAYMNYYNETTKKGFKCFLCGRQSVYEFDYQNQGDGVELKQPNYLVDGPNGVYQAVPPQNTFIFMVDVSKQAAQCKMLSYFVTVVKDVLARQDMNETQIYFYTYDQTVHQYDFSGEYVERTILDPTIKNANARSPDCSLGSIRDKLFIFLDSLQQVAQKNTRQGSNFMKILQYVYENIKHTGGKMFIFQANEAIIAQNFTVQNFKWNTNPQQTQKIKNSLQSKNKLFFNRFVQFMLNDNISMSLFFFGRAYKNMKVFADTCKLTNSQLMYYTKDCEEQLLKYYYDLYHLLGATYYIDTRIEMIISSGWYYSAVYGNIYRLKEYITFKICHYQASKRICAVFNPQEGFNPMPYFSLQVITNYVYGRKHYMAVNTAVLPFTTNLDRLFQNINIQVSAATVFKIYLSMIRLQDLNSCKNKYIKHMATIWKAANDYYKGNLTPQFRNLVLSFLSFLKNYHTQIDIINESLIMQKVVSHRNLLQSCNYQELNTNFAPYLFDLATIGQDRCLDDNFIYPDLCELKFASVKEGVYLMDAGSVLYLYFAKTYHPNFCLSLLGKQKISKNDLMNQQILNAQDNQFSSQVKNLIRVIREGKTYGWVPLHIIRQGQASINQKNFYLNFYQQKYEEFKTYKLSYDQFVGMLSKQY